MLVCQVLTCMVFHLKLPYLVDSLCVNPPDYLFKISAKSLYLKTTQAEPCLEIVHNLYALLRAHNSPKLSVVRTAMLILVLSKNVSILIFSALSTYFKRSQTHSLTVKHLLQVGAVIAA